MTGLFFFAAEVEEEEELVGAEADADEEGAEARLAG